MLACGYQLFTSAMRAEPRITEAFRTGAGMHWGEHDAGLFSGTERFFRGALVADVGCGHGASTVILARAHPNSRATPFNRIFEARI